MSVEPIGHELELSVRRDERDGAVVLEAREANTLVELDVLELHRAAASYSHMKVRFVMYFSVVLISSKHVSTIILHAITLLNCVQYSRVLVIVQLH